MILLRSTRKGQHRLADLSDLFAGQTALLVGGAPSLKEQPLHLLEQRGVLTAAMNNAAIHFRPDLWISSDHPECYEPQILMDPKIMKFAPVGHADIQLGPAYGNMRYADMPNMFLYIQDNLIPMDAYLDDHKGVPWYMNTLLSSIHILYQLGIRTIILGGSDFSCSPLNAMYAHATALDDLQRKWNMDLYNHLVDELCTLKPYFESKRLLLMDCSKNSRLSHTYKHLTMEEAVAVCLRQFPKEMVDPKTLPHCSKFANMDLKKAVAGWSRHIVIEPVVKHTRKVGSLQTLI